MTKELKRLSLVVLVMFLALFVSTSMIQVIEADDLAANSGNIRARLDSYEVQRGSIVAGGTAIASSVPDNSQYRWKRVYQEPLMWAPVTGYMNAAIGVTTGIEAAMNQELSGTANTQFFSRIDSMLTGQLPRGSNVNLSLDPEIQKTAFEALGDLEGAIVAIEPSTGRILALVSTPSFDTNKMAVLNPSEVDAYHDSLVADPLEPLSNRAIAGSLNPPASTFKIVTLSAALNSGNYTPESQMPNPESMQLPQSNSRIHNHDMTTCGPGATASLSTALELSCNIPFAEVAIELGSEQMRTTAEGFGFNQHLEIPLEVSASVYPENLDAPQTALTGFGQGQLLATPLQMAMVSAGIANEGVVMYPRMVDTVVASDLSVQHRFENVELSRAVSPEIANEIRDIMVKGVESGAATGARIDGVDVAGKTGTAEMGGDRPYSLWFTGFAPANNPRVAVAVLLENGAGQGQSGSSNAIAAPIAKQVMEAVLGR